MRPFSSQQLPRQAITPNYKRPTIPPAPDSNLLTVTVLESQIKHDMSSFYATMSSYAVVSVNGDSRRSDSVKGTVAKFRDASFAFRTSANDHLIDLQIFCENFLVKDTLIGYSVLKVQGGIAGQSTDWVELKSEPGQKYETVGRVLVSISREILETEGDYTHIV